MQDVVLVTNYRCADYLTLLGRTQLAHEVEKKKPAQGGLYSSVWWRWRESNSRPKVLHSQDYMLSRVIVLSPRNR